jgi:ribosomal protein L1
MNKCDLTKDKMPEPVRMRRKMDITESIIEKKNNMNFDVQNFSTNKVLGQFRDDQFEISKFVRGMLKLKPEKVWKPNKFKF